MDLLNGTSPAVGFPIKTKTNGLVASKKWVQVKNVIKHICFLIFNMKIQHDSHLSTSCYVITSPRRGDFSLCQLS